MRHQSYLLLRWTPAAERWSRAVRCTQATHSLVCAICSTASCGLAPARLIPDSRFDLGALLAHCPLLPSKVFTSPSQRRHTLLPPCPSPSSAALLHSNAGVAQLGFWPNLGSNFGLQLGPSLPRTPSSDAAVNLRCHPGHLQTGHPTVRVVLLPRSILSIPSPPHAAHPARGDADRVAWARRRRAIIASLPLNEEPVPISMRCVAALGPPGFGRMLVDTMRFRRRCVCGSRNRDCRLSTLARASVARATAPTPLACGCPRFRCYPTAFHSRVRTFAHQLPSMFRRIRSVNLFFERLSWSPSTRFRPRHPESSRDAIDLPSSRLLDSPRPRINLHWPLNVNSPPRNITTRCAARLNRQLPHASYPHIAAYNTLYNAPLLILLGLHHLHIRIHYE
ncbi:hypothetical protein B0H13DRAFT_2343679 [Mycena leptocephala]|nr:hypothetical protein B0H13DRAFT_2343679 [Mycena leptocephala]